MEPFKGGESLASVPFYRGRNSYAVAAQEKDEEDHFGAAGDREIQIQSYFSFRKNTSSENITFWRWLLICRHVKRGR